MQERTEEQMLARPKSWFSNDWLVTNDDGQEVLLDLSAWRERAQFELGGRLFELEKASAFSPDFVLRSGGQVVSRAEKPSLLRNRFELEIGGEAFLLKKVSAMGRRFEIRRGETVVGGVSPENLFTRRTQLDLPGEWPLEVRLFVFWLVAVIWNREAHAAAS